jgi:hypothetical protein
MSEAMDVLCIDICPSASAGDKLQDELGDDELEGEYDVEAIVDEVSERK